MGLGRPVAENGNQGHPRRRAKRKARHETMKPAAEQGSAAVMPDGLDPLAPKLTFQATRSAALP
jgi:hypothetical protein